MSRTLRGIVHGTVGVLWSPPAFLHKQMNGVPGKRSISMPCAAARLWMNSSAPNRKIIELNYKRCIHSIKIRSGAVHKVMEQLVLGAKSAAFAVP